MKERDIRDLLAANSVALKRVAALLESMAALLERTSEGFAEGAEELGVVCDVVGEVTSAIARLQPFEGATQPVPTEVRFADDLTTKRMAVPDHLIAAMAAPSDCVPRALPLDEDRTPAGPVTQKMGSVPPGVPAGPGRKRRRRRK